MSSSNKINVILTNLNEKQLSDILKTCNNEKIHYTFDNEYYGSEYYEIYSFLEKMILKNKKISITYQKLINEYLDFINECDDEEYKNKIFEKISNIEYE